MKTLALFKKITLIVSALILALTAVFAYAYWFGETRAHVGFGIKVADEPFGGNPMARLPFNTPDDVYNKVETMIADGVPLDIMDVLVDALVDIVDDLNFTMAQNVLDGAEYAGIMVAKDIDALFTDYNWNGANRRGYYAVYAETVNNKPQSKVVYIGRGAVGENININNRTSFENALNYRRNGVNVISSNYIATNWYTKWSASVKVNVNGADKKYLPFQQGGGLDNSNPPNRNNAWVEFIPGYAYGGRGPVVLDFIVYWGSQYYISVMSTWGPPQDWMAPWQIIHPWVQGVYSQGAVVRTTGLRIWRAMRSGVTSMPGEQSARAGDWQEIDNGWHGAMEFNNTAPYYYPHNNYNAGQIAVYGVSSRNTYRYFKAKKTVPPGQRPLMDITRQPGYPGYDSRINKSEVIVNTEYWEQINA